MKNKLTAWIALILTTSTAVAEAHTLSLTNAQALAAQATSACAAKGREVAVAVLDTGGQSLLLQRGANVGPHNLEAARRKAYTALSTKSSTLTLGRNARSNPDTANLAYLPELLLLGGGLPLWQGDTLVGALAVAGGGGPEADEGCALAAVHAGGFSALPRQP